MKYTPLVVSFCIVVGFGVATPDRSVDSPGANVENTHDLPGYLGDMVVGGQKFESYLVPAILGEEAIDFLTANRIERISITSTTVISGSKIDKRTVRILSPSGIDESAMGGAIRIRYRYFTGSGEVVDSLVECEETVFERNGTVFECANESSSTKYAVHVVPRSST